MYYYIKDADKVVLVDQDKQRLQTSLRFMPQYTGIEIYESENPVEAYRPPLTADEEKAKLKSYLSNTDYITNKIVESGLSLADFLAVEGNEKYTDMLAQREAARQKINELETQP